MLSIPLSILKRHDFIFWISREINSLSSAYLNPPLVTQSNPVFVYIVPVNKQILCGVEKCWNLAFTTLHSVVWQMYALVAACRRSVVETTRPETNDFQVFTNVKVVVAERRTQLCIRNYASVEFHKSLFVRNVSNGPTYLISFLVSCHPLYLYIVFPYNNYLHFLTSPNLILRTLQLKLLKKRTYRMKELTTPMALNYSIWRFSA